MPVLVALVVAVLIGTTVFAIAAARATEHSGEVDEIDAVARAVGTVAARRPRLRRFLVARRDPSTDTGLLLTVAIAGVAASIVVVGALLTMVDTNSGFARWDDSAARFGATNTSDGSTTVLELVTHLGSWWFVTIVVAAVGVVQYRIHRRRAIPVFLASAVLTTGAVNTIVKWVVDRDRPDIARLVHARGSSFPSGHSATAAVTCAAVAFVLCRYRTRSRRLVIATVAAVITVAVAASRVLLGVHWLTDVIAGVFVGWSCCVLNVIAFGGRVMHFGEPVEDALAAARAAPSTTSSDVETTS